MKKNYMFNYLYRCNLHWLLLLNFICAISLQAYATKATNSELNNNTNFYSSFNWQSTDIITNLSATTSKSYVLTELVSGTALYTDRAYQVTTVPASLNNSAFIRTPNDDKKNTSSNLLSFQLPQPSVLYVAYDPRATALPTWLSGWEKLNIVLGTNDPGTSFMNLYSKTFPAGSVTLGGNLASPASGSLTNYLVFGTATACSPISTLPCDQVTVSLPVNLTFDGAAANSIKDKNGMGTGFTMVDTYSGTRLSADGTPTNSSVPGYEVSKLTISGGRLQYVTNKGISFTNNNNQLNALGVKINTGTKLQIETTIINPVYGTDAQQGGLWFGLNDKTFVKLVVTGNKVELRREVNDVSQTADQRITGVISGLNQQTVRLRLITDPATNTVEGFYSTDGLNYVNVGAAYTTKSLSIAGMGLTSSAYAGIYATHRNASTPVTFTFDDFSVKDVFMQEVKINFQDPSTVPPAGWLRDFGQPYGVRNGTYQDKNLSYGWRKRSDGSLLDLSVGGTIPGNGRKRTTPADVLQATLMHMQADDISGSFNGTKAEGYWELKVPNGAYEITVSVGDADIHASPESHSLNVEGVKAIDNFEPSGIAGASSRFKTATVKVNVIDEHLTINADGGFNTKINSVHVVPLTVNAYTFWSANSQELTIKKGSNSSATTFSLDLSNSLNRTDIQYNLSAVYSTGGTNWLAFNTVHASSEPNVTFDYSVVNSLPTGNYTATVTATAPSFTGGSFVVYLTVEAERPYVISSTPAKGAVNVSINTSSIAANDLYVPEVAPYKGGVDNSTITNNTVKLLKLVNGTTTEIMGVVQGTGGGDAISFSPSFALEPNTVYKFVITDGVKSYSGASFIPYEATFTTGAELYPTEILPVEFTKVPIPSTQNKKYTSLTFGPDGKFYALRLDGVIERYTVQADGMLSELFEINTLVNKYGNRSAVGLTFDKNSTATSLSVWVSHCSAGLEYAPEFDGNLSLLSGSKLENEVLMVTKLPRSRKDHLVNSLAFGPDGALYINQGSNSSMGAYDGSWQRIESLLSGAVLRLDLNKLSKVGKPLDVYTTADQQIINNAPAVSMRMTDNSYNPYGSEAPLTIYASGVRNAYDLVWHSNGQLYVPTNGSAAGGNSPASVAGTRRLDGTFYNGPTVPATSSVQVQNDWLFRINPLKPFGYYGHPNPLRGEYIANRGYADNTKYPTSLGPDPNYRGAAYNFEFNKSPNGAIEYKSNTFNGALKGKLLVCRFSGGGDIIVLEPGSMVKDPSVTSSTSDDSMYDIVNATTGAGTSGLVGMSGFTNPIDLVEDTKTGNLYVIEFNWNNSTTKTSQITLLRVQQKTEPEGEAAVYPQSISSTEMVGETETQSYPVTISNTGKGTLKVTGIEILGADASQFKVKGAPEAKANKQLKIHKNRSVTFNVSFNPTSKGLKKAKLQVVSQKKKKNQIKEVELIGLGIVYEDEEAAVSAARKETNTPNKETIKTSDKVFKVYPNPNAGKHISIELLNYGKQEKVTIVIHDLLGRAIQSNNLIADDQGIIKTELNFKTSLNRGIYVVKVYDSSKIISEKIIVK